MAKEKSAISKLLPVALGGALLGLGGFWLIVGLILLLCKASINPVFWIIGGVLFVIGLTLTLISKKPESK